MSHCGNNLCGHPDPVECMCVCTGCFEARQAYGECPECGRKHPDTRGACPNSPDAHADLGIGGMSYEDWKNLG